MTNDQKFLSFMNQVDELLKTLDKIDHTKSTLYNGTAKQQRKDIKIFLIQNRIVTAAPLKPAPPVVKHKTPNRFNHNQNWLAQ